MAFVERASTPGRRSLGRRFLGHLEEFAQKPGSTQLRSD